MTNKQYVVLDFIKRYISEYNYPPTIREIMNGLGLKSPSTVQEHLRGLINAGVITYKNNKSRTIELLVENEYIRDDITTIKSIEDDRTIKVNTFLLSDYDIEKIRFLEEDKIIYILYLDPLEKDYSVIKEDLNYKVIKGNKSNSIASVISKMELL